MLRHHYIALIIIFAPYEQPPKRPLYYLGEEEEKSESCLPRPYLVMTNSSALLGLHNYVLVLTQAFIEFCQESESVENNLNRAS